MSKDHGLTAPQLKFCQLLRSDPLRIASKSYMGAYPRCLKETTAEAAASRLLRNVKIIAYLAEKDSKSLARCEITADRVNEEKAAIAFFRIGDIFHPTGQLKAPHEMDAATQASVSSIEIEAKAVGKGEDREIVLISKVKMHNKVPLLDQLSKQLGQYEKDNLQQSGGMADLIAAVDGKTRGLPDPEDVE